ncbi:uncharacterized protein LOC125674305 isoform X2 [Ostrea edulis]|uniref:uncharacterized protein LOC125674305 isoform X2 n=1 Tax=Ostrea edulis TaxID=37623 RepID=UPI0024AFD80B|nr:uncharacterized protein LOC125674305 isoform X2 [Ostrea edulis]
MKIAPSVYFLGVFGLVTYVESTYYCSGSGDPCTQASTLFENYARTENCKHDGVHSPCDRYITPGWYVTDNPILDQCPDLLSCGAVYPVWFNGSLPTSGDGIVTEKLCKTGFFDCCTRTYDIQIKNCGTHYVYCLPALDACPERICFGTNGSCEYPTTTTPTTTSTIPTTTTESKYVPSKDYNDLKSKYIVAIVTVVLLVAVISAVTGAIIFYVYKKKKQEREVRQSKVTLPGNEFERSSTPVESNTPPFMHFQSSNKHY